MAAVPGVEAAAAISQLPLGDPASGQPFTIEGRTFAPGERPSADYRAISPNYFPALIKSTPMIFGLTQHLTQ